ncbi:MAG: hypothetical protein F6K21_37785 [Symploca sp. SIO2D2]|nr:hypothetical protein [Symploca sp. SIO2D2]
MALSRPRLQVVQNDEIAKAIKTIRKHLPGLINDSMLVTSALVEYALALESDKPQQAHYQTPYRMAIVKTGSVTCETGIFGFLIRNFSRIAAIFAHIGNEDDEFMDYISRGEKPVYTFVLKGKGFTDFEFIHVATAGSLFEECLTLLVLDFKHYRDDLRFNVIYANQFEKRWGRKSVNDYVPPLDEMAERFFQDESYLFGGGGGKTSCTLDLDWEADTTSYQGFEIEDTRFIDYSHALVGLKPSSLTTEKYGVQDLVRSGVLAVDRDLLHYRYRCLCDGWTEEQQDLDLYELGHIFGQHFGYRAIFSTAQFLNEIASCTTETASNATVYVENGKRIEVLPMKWKNSWFTSHVDGKASDHGWSHLDDDPNPFRLYDMNDFFPDHLEQYKQKKKKQKK